MPGGFSGQVAIVTGGGRGIGRAVALLLAQEGCRVLVCDIGGAVAGGGANGSVASDVVEEIARSGGEAKAWTADIATMDGASGAVGLAMNSWGRVDILFNGAGILRSEVLLEMEEDTWDIVTRVNLKSVFAMCRHAAPVMARQKTGYIVNCSSPAGYGQYGASAYATTKEGLVGFTRTLARELGQYGVRVNAIRPCAASRMFTPEVDVHLRYAMSELGLPPVGDQWLPGMNGQAPDCEPDQVASVVAWLCRPELQVLNGRVLYITGGFLALCEEPELVKARFNASGWTLDSLLDPAVVQQFTWGQINMFAAGR